SASTNAQVHSSGDSARARDPKPAVGVLPVSRDWLVCADGSRIELEAAAHRSRAARDFVRDRIRGGRMVLSQPASPLWKCVQFQSLGCFAMVAWQSVRGLLFQSRA